MSTHNTMSNMTPETIQAIHDSIQHWCRMRSDPFNRLEQPFAEDCPLCELFYFGHRCSGCPIMEKTGMPECGFTPYAWARITWEDLPDFAIGTKTQSAIRTWHLAANAEIAFLNSLLPQNTPNP